MVKSFYRAPQCSNIVLRYYEELVKDHRGIPGLLHPGCIIYVKEAVLAGMCDSTPGQRRQVCGEYMIGSEPS